MPKELNLTGFVRFSSLLSIVVGLIGLTGCFFHVQILRTIVPGLVAIDANTALSFVLLGGSLWCLREQDGTASAGGTRWLGKAAATIAGVVGFLSMAEFLGRLDFGIDQLLFTETVGGALGQVRPGLMSPVTALDLVLLGLSLLLLDWVTRRRTWPAQVLAFTAGIIALFTFLDLIVDPHHDRAHIALPTLVVLSTFPLAVICAWPKRALRGLLLAAGSKRTLFRQLIFPPFAAGSKGGPLHYLLAVVLVAAATVTRHVFEAYLPAGTIFITFYPAVMVAALVGGLGPGILATLLSAACTDYFFVPPVGTFFITTGRELLGLLMFTAVGIALSWMASAVEQTREKAVEETRRAKEEWELTFNSVPEAVMVLDEEFRIRRANQAMCSLVNGPADAIIGKHCYELVHQTPTPVAGCPLRRMLHSRSEEEAEITEKRLGKVFDVTASPLRENGCLRGCVHVIRDITERKRAEEALTASELRYRRLFETAKDAILMLDADTEEITDANQFLLDMLGYSHADVVGKKLWEIGPLKDVVACRTAFAELQDREYVRYEDLPLETKDGRSLSVEFISNVYQVEGKKVIQCNIRDITERKQAEEAVRKLNQELERRVQERTAELQAVFATVPIGLAIADDSECRHIRGNPAFERMVGALQGAEVSRSAPECIPYRVFQNGHEQPPEDLPMQRATRGQSVSGELLEIVRADETRVMLHSSAAPLFDVQGRLRGSVGAFVDITELKKAEERVRRSQRTFTELVERAPFGIYIVDSRFRIAHMNTSSQTGAFRNVRPVIGRDFSQAMRTLWPEPVAAEIIGHFQQTLETGEPYYSPQFTNPRQDVGMVESYEWELHRMLLPDGQYGVICYYFDSTALRQTEAALRDKEELLRAVTDNSPDAIYVKDGSSRWLMANPAVLRVVGRTAEQALGKTDLELYADAAVGRAIMENDRRTMEAGRTEEFEEVADTPDGRRTFLSVKAPRRDMQGNIIGLIGISHDITARKLVEEAVRDSELRFRSLANTVPDLVWTCTPDGKCDFFSARWIEYTGIPAEDQLGYAWLNQVHPDDRERLISDWRESLEHDQPFDIEFRIRNHQGLYRWFKTRAVALRDQNGRVLKWFGTNTDIEDLRRFQQELTAANKELESFNYAVAHDLRAPLRHIHGFADLLAQDAASVLNEASQKHLQIIRESVERMGRLLQELLNLSRLGRQELRKQPCDLNLLFRQVLAELMPETANREIEWRVGDLATVECDTTLMKQVLLNLVSNAIKFTRKRSPAVIEIGQTMRNGVPAIFVRDNGEGFDMKYADKLFGIFQRLHRKEDFEGTGVGLAIVQRIVHRHGGSIWAEAELSRGATFYFSLNSCELERRNHRAAAEVA